MNTLPDAEKSGSADNDDARDINFESAVLCGHLERDWVIGKLPFIRAKVLRDNPYDNPSKSSHKEDLVYAKGVNDFADRVMQQFAAIGGGIADDGGTTKEGECYRSLKAQIALLEDENEDLRLAKEAIKRLMLINARQKTEINELELQLSDSKGNDEDQFPSAFKAVISVHRQCLQNLPTDMKRPRKANIEGFIRTQGIQEVGLLKAVYTVSTYGFKMGGHPKSSETRPWRPLSER